MRLLTCAVILLASIQMVSALRLPIDAETERERFIAKERQKRLQRHAQELSSASASTLSSGSWTNTTEWNTQLLNSTYPHGYHPGVFAPGYSALVGDKYVTTDISDRLYAIDANTGAIAWTYHSWPKLSPPSLAAQRQITGGNSTIIVYRGATVYYFNATNGDVMFTKAIDGTNAVVYAYANQLLIEGENTVETWDLVTGSTIHVFPGAITSPVAQTQTRDTANSDGSRNLVAFGQYLDGHAEYFKLVVYNLTSGALAMESSRTFKQGESLPYIFAVDGNGVYTIDFGTSESTISKYNLITGAIDYATKTVQGVVAGYGVAPDNYIFFHFKLGMACYNRATGKLVSQTPSLPGIHYINHIEGYQAWGLLAMTTDNDELNVTAWSSTHMQSDPLWTIKTADKNFGSVIFGNWIGYISFMQRDGFLMYYGNPTKTSSPNDWTVVYDGTDQYKDVNYQSFVDTNERMVLFFTHGDHAVSIRYSK